jgi:hypothetical protein
MGRFCKRKHEYIHTIIPVLGNRNFLKYGKKVVAIIVNTPTNKLAEHEVYFIERCS